MSKVAQKLVNRLLRKTRVRATVSGTSERPRLSVHISNRHISVQIIDDSKHRTIAGTTSATAKAATGSLQEKAAWAGTDIAKKAKKAGVTKVVFDRGGRQYKARLQTLADAARKEGLEF